MPVRLPEEMVEFMESGVSILVGSRDGSLHPECVRGVGARVAPDRERVTVYLNEALAGRTCANLGDNGQIVVTFSRTVDHRTLQVKGDTRAVRPSTEEERGVQERYLSAWSEQLYVVGLPRAIARRIKYWPSVAVDFEVRDLFVQTPGPGAGRKVDT